MAATNHAKLGFFLVASLAVTIGFAIFFLEQLRDRPALYGVTYFDEAIGGLRADSPVRYRGVDIGRVQKVALDFDTTYIRVEFEVWIDALPEWETQALKRNVKDIDPLLRAQISTVGLIGQSFLQVDRLDEPPPVLAIDNIPAGRHYLPSRASDMTSLVRNMRASLSQMPAILERLDETLGTVQQKIDAIDIEGLTSEAQATLAGGTATLKRVNGLLDRYTQEGGPADRMLLASTELMEEARKRITTGSSFDQALKRFSSLGARIEDTLAKDGKLAGLLDEIQANLEAFDTASFNKNLTVFMQEIALMGDEMRALLPELQLSFAQLREFLRSFNEEPEQLIFGPRSNGETAP